MKLLTKSTNVLLGAALLAALGWLASPTPARACGGFFCQSMPMNQSGENIVFAAESDGTMIAHVQILYSGTADAFAWILPVPALPVLSVGTDALFEALARDLSPRFLLRDRTEGACRPEPACPGIPGPFYDSGAISADASAPTAMVHFRGAVGPYDAAILSAGDLASLRTWLTDNAYDIPAEADPLLAEYVAEGDYFVALKLLSDRSTSELQPIALRFTESQPCIPIRLTRIATVPDMPITAYVLGPVRATPSNYVSVLPDLENPAHWLSSRFGAVPPSYLNAVTRAVDDAGGRAFVTEYAGTPPSVALALAPIDDLRGSTPQGLIQGIGNRGYNQDSGLLGLLLRFLPPPDGLDPTSFYNCLFGGFCDPAHNAYIDTLAANVDPLIDEIEARIRTPRSDAQAMLGRHAKITRLFTTMSAADMTEDPVFVFNASAPDVSQTHEATRVAECSGDYFRYAAPQRMEFSSGRSVLLQEGVPYYGTDAQYCDDVEAGLFGPGVRNEIALDTSLRRRPMAAGGGGGCAAVATAGASAGLGGLMAMVLVFLLARRRRRAERRGAH